MFQEYTTVTQAAKDAALNERRLNHFLKLSAEIYRAEQEKGAHLEEVKAYETRIAVLKFEFAEVSPEHPLYEEKKKNNEDQIKFEENMITTKNKMIESLDKEIADLKQKQQDTVDGKIKMDYDAIVCRAKELIATHVETKFKDGEYDTKA